MLDLDALAPEHHEIKLNGKTYSVPKSVNDLPVLKATKAIELLQQLDEDNPQVEILVKVIKIVTGMPSDEVDALTSQQIEGLCKLLFPQDAKAAATEANPTTAANCTGLISGCECGERHAKSGASTEGFEMPCP